LQSFTQYCAWEKCTCRKINMCFLRSKTKEQGRHVLEC
jgi:hypothetical protein